MKLVTGLLGALGLSATAWSGAWVYGKGAIRDSVDEQIALMREQGIEASYSSIDIGGFPFGYDGRVVGPRYAMTAPTVEGPVTYRWEAPWVGVDASAGDLGGLSFTVPETQVFRIEPPLNAPPVTVRIESEAFRGRLSQVEGRPHIDAQADALTMVIGASGDTAVDSGSNTVDQDDQTVDSGAVETPNGTISLISVTFSGTGPLAIDGVAVNADFDTEATAASATIDMAFGDAAPIPTEAIAAEAKSVRVVSRSRDQRVDTELAAQDIALTTAVDGTSLGVVGIGAVTGDISAPAFLTEQAQQVAAAFRFTGVDPDARIWQALDPTGAFPRDIQEIALDAQAMASLADGFLRPRSVTIKRLALRGIGVEVDGDAKGGFVAGQPEGEATLRFTGVGGFIDNAVAAGLMPQQQATVYKLMVENFARKGATEGQKVFNVAMRNGLTYVNGLPVGPAPALPQ